MTLNLSMPALNIFRSKTKNYNVTDKDPTYKVRYLGNVQTAMMKGDGCVDKATAVLWNNFIKTTNGGIDMKLNVCASGLKAYTKELGLTEYRAHRISYCIAHPRYPRLFVWVYRHEGKKMKVELRCHAVLCKSEDKAKAMAVQLHDKLSLALSEFVREKTRRQNTRLNLQRTRSLPSGATDMPGEPLRRKMLSTGQNFKPSIDRSASAPKLCSISEDNEPEEFLAVEDEGALIMHEIEEEKEVKDEDAEFDRSFSRYCSGSRDDSDLPSVDSVTCGVRDEQCQTHSAPEFEFDDLSEALFDIEIGNDLEALKNDKNVQYLLTHNDSDDDSSESGYSESHDGKDGTLNGSGNDVLHEFENEGVRL